MIINSANIEARDVYIPLGSIITGTQKGGATYKVEDVTLTNVHVDSFRGGLSEMPAPLGEYPWFSNWNVAAWPNFPAWAYTIRHADNVVFKNVTHSVSPEDVREDIVLEDVTGFKIVGDE